MELKGLIYAIVSAVFFGSAGVLIKQGYTQNVTPSELLIIQYIIAITIMFTISMIKYRKELKLKGKLIIKLAILGTFGNAVMTIALYSAMAYLDVAVATILLYTYPSMVALSSFILYKEKISRIKILAIIGTFSGCLLVVDLWSGHSMPISFIGIGFGLLSAAAYSFMNIYADTIVEDVPPLVITFISTIFSLFLLMVFNADFLPRLSSMPIGVVSNAAMLAIFCEIIPLSLLYAAIGYIGPVKTSIISTLEVPVASLSAFFIMGERLSIPQYAGIALVLLSITILKKE
ncbi:putative inner membrane transporter YicL [Oxobacter pfennigii]|uniref:Putative inner membrane transporter YicL n=1 Tax=Oxobacter pfennigii TaxID=36849 RepID=A0A0P8WC26_9CLOT|nr:DMT family transporter [Oxobacter pfennigii]KPU46283.1 putative inner membrane transporter YicL [Oxobacter pfennigii]